MRDIRNVFGSAIAWRLVLCAVAITILISGGIKTGPTTLGAALVGMGLGLARNWSEKWTQSSFGWATFWLITGGLGMILFESSGDHARILGRNAYYISAGLFGIGISDLVVSVFRKERNPK